MDDQCSECGFVYDTRRIEEVSAVLGREVAATCDLLSRAADPAERREPATWSPLEYACHVRDVLLVQRERVLAARRVDLPSFEPMGREERVEHDGYAEQRIEDVVRQLGDAVLLFGNVVNRLTPTDRDRRVIYNYPNRQERSLGWMAVHTLHEIVHHAGDIRRQVS